MNIWKMEFGYIVPFSSHIGKRTNWQCELKLYKWRRMHTIATTRPVGGA